MSALNPLKPTDRIDKEQFNESQFWLKLAFLELGVELLNVLRKSLILVSIQPNFLAAIHTMARVLPITERSNRKPVLVLK